MTISPDGKWMWDGSNWIPAPPQEAPEELIEQPVVETQPEPTEAPEELSEQPVVETQPEPTAVLPAGLPPTTISADPPAIDETMDMKDSVIGSDEHSSAWICKSRHMVLMNINGFSSDILSDFEAHFRQHEVHLVRWRWCLMGPVYTISGTELMLTFGWTKQNANIAITMFKSRNKQFFFGPLYGLVVFLLSKKKFQNNLLKAKEIAAMIDSFITVTETVN